MSEFSPEGMENGGGGISVDPEKVLLHCADQGERRVPLEFGTFFSPRIGPAFCCWDVFFMMGFVSGRTFLSLLPFVIFTLVWMNWKRKLFLIAEMLLI